MGLPIGMEKLYLIIGMVKFCSLRTVVGIYTPQVNKRIFSTNLIKQIEQYAEGSLILMGDFNCILDKEGNKSKRTSVHSGFPQVLKKWLKEKEMVDIWREQNRSVSDYTFYSRRYNIYSRIDYPSFKVV